MSSQPPSPYSNYQPPQRPKSVLSRLWDTWLFLWQNHRRVALVFAAIVIVFFGSIVVTATVQSVQQNQQQATFPATSVAATAIPQVQTTQPDTETPTPMPTVSFTQQVNQQATNDAVAAAQFAVSGSINSNYDSSAKSIVITEGLQQAFDNGAYVTAIKSDCFTIQQKVWQDTSLKLSSVEIHMTATATDQYGKQSTTLAGSCTLNASTESNFVWSNLDYASAWDNNAYDLTYLDPSLTK